MVITWKEPLSIWGGKWIFIYTRGIGLMLIICVHKLSATLSLMRLRVLVFMISKGVIRLIVLSHSLALHNTQIKAWSHRFSWNLLGILLYFCNSIWYIFYRAYGYFRSLWLGLRIRYLALLLYLKFFKLSFVIFWCYFMLRVSFRLKFEFLIDDFIKIFDLLFFDLLILFNSFKKLLCCLMIGLLYGALINLGLKSTDIINLSHFDFLMLLHLHISFMMPDILVIKEFIKVPLSIRRVNLRLKGWKILIWIFLNRLFKNLCNI